MRFTLAPDAKRYTFDVVGEQYYEKAEKILHDKAAAAGGSCVLEFELIPEPDNPHDDHAISVRYQDEVVGYIPRSRNRSIWSDVTRVLASGYIPVAMGQVEAWGNGSSASVALALGGGRNMLGDESDLLPAQRGGYTPPDAYGIAATLPIPPPQHTKLARPVENSFFQNRTALAPPPPPPGRRASGGLEPKHKATLIMLILLVVVALVFIFWTWIVEAVKIILGLIIFFFMLMVDAIMGRGKKGNRRS
ncbi:MAG TPA: hypothetical protein GX530_00645 [Corynebacteriales bacterium]|nr:hypothetical protein [Mycobacteriales bacterium]